MRPFVVPSLVCAGLAALIACGPVRASDPCLPCPEEAINAPLPAPRYELRTVTRYRTENRTEYREVQRTVLRRVPEVQERQVQETVMVPCTREEVRERTTMVPKVHMETRERTVMRTDYREEQRARTIMTPVTEQVEQLYKVLVPDVHEEQCTRTVMGVVLRPEERERAVTTVRTVAQAVATPIMTVAHVATEACDPCTGQRIVTCQAVPRLTEAITTCLRPIAETHLEHYTTMVASLQPKTETVTVQVPSA